MFAGHESVVGQPIAEGVPPRLEEPSKETATVRDHVVPLTLPGERGEEQPHRLLARELL